MLRLLRSGGIPGFVDISLTAGNARIEECPIFDLGVIGSGVPLSLVVVRPNTPDPDTELKYTILSVVPLRDHDVVILLFDAQGEGREVMVLMTSDGRNKYYYPYATDATEERGG